MQFVQLDTCQVLADNGLWPLVVFLFLVLVFVWCFCLVLGLLVFFFPLIMLCFPSPSMMIWALRPHGVRTRGKKCK